MSELDDQLQAALEEKGSGVTTNIEAESSDPEPPKRNLGLLLGLLAGAVAIVALVMSFKENAVYAKTVDQVVADRAKLAGRSVRIEGTLVKGTLKQKMQPCEHRFVITNKGAKLPVVYRKCVVPDTFRDRPDMDVKVTVEGKLAASGDFDASVLMAKCPSKYEMREKAKRGEKAPHRAMKTSSAQ